VERALGILCLNCLADALTSFAELKTKSFPTAPVEQALPSKPTIGQVCPECARATMVKESDSIRCASCGSSFCFPTEDQSSIFRVAQSIYRDTTSPSSRQATNERGENHPASHSVFRGTCRRVVSCPACSSMYCRRSVRQGYRDFFHRLLGRFPWHCRQCGDRFYLWKRYPSRA